MAEGSEIMEGKRMTLYDAQQAAEYCGCHYSKIIKECKNAGVPRLGKKRTFTKEELDYLRFYGHFAPRTTSPVVQEEICIELPKDLTQAFGKSKSGLKAVNRYEEALELPKNQKRKSLQGQ